jgi:putative hydrolase of the HAD superfamily
MPVGAVICDFGGVLTTPLMNSFAAVQDHTGISPDALGRAMQRVAEQEGSHPLFELEKGSITEDRFLALLREGLAPELGHSPELHRFREIYFDALDPNQPMIELMRSLKRRGYRMAMLTNNIREWEPYWRSMLPVDEIFETVVDSGFVGMRKPDPAIYELTVQRLGGVVAADCLFVDDTDVNCEAARKLGMTVVQFRDNEQAIAEIEATLSAASRATRAPSPAPAPR